MIDELYFDFCSIKIFETYIISTVHEGQTVIPIYNDAISHISETYFKDKRFLYITHRINSYGVDPSIYYKTCKIDNLKGVAIVSQDYKARANIEVEKLFITKPFKVFTSLEAAIEWGHLVI